MARRPLTRRWSLPPRNRSIFVLAVVGGGSTSGRYVDVNKNEKTVDHSGRKSGQTGAYDKSQIDSECPISRSHPIHFL